MPEVTVHDNVLPSGARCRIEVPDNWNEDLLLQAAPIPVAPGDPPWDDGADRFRAFFERGYAIAGSASNIFWPLESGVADQGPLLDLFEKLVGTPRHTIAIGSSIGGIMTAAVVQVMPERISGALPMCGNLAGAVAIHNREFDMAFVVKHLLGRSTDLEVVKIRDPDGNLRIASDLLEQAQNNAKGRARLALVAAIGNVPGWFRATDEPPPEDNFAARETGQHAWFDEVVFLVLFSLRAQVEQQAGGNASWNFGVDYAERLGSSINRAQVHGLYEEAGLEVEADLEILANADRIDADPESVAYLERNISFSGDLNQVPVVVMHSIGDGLVTPDNALAYAEVVHWAGNEHLLRLLWVGRGGHCAFTDSERLTALDVLVRRIESGSWGSTSPDDLNVRASHQSDRHSRVVGMGASPGWPSMKPSFRDFFPNRFPRMHDVRDSRT